MIDNFFNAFLTATMGMIIFIIISGVYKKYLKDERKEDDESERFWIVFITLVLTCWLYSGFF